MNKITFQILIFIISMFLVFPLIIHAASYGISPSQHSDEMLLGTQREFTVYLSRTSGESEASVQVNFEGDNDILVLEGEREFIFPENASTYEYTYTVLAVKPGIYTGRVRFIIAQSEEIDNSIGIGYGLNSYNTISVVSDVSELQYVHQLSKHDGLLSEITLSNFSVDIIFEAVAA